jgi:hypothetical protein
MISNGRSMKCGGRCENVCLQIGQYHMKSHMFSIDMVGCDIVMGGEWLRTLGPILMDFKELIMQFIHDGQQHKFQGITTSSPNIITSHLMEKLLKKGLSGIIAQLHSFKPLRQPLCLLTSNPSSPNIKLFFHSMDFLLPVVFMTIPFPSYLTSFLPMFIPIVIPFPRKMKMIKLFNHCLSWALSILVIAPILLLWSWYLQKKALGACVLNFVPSINSPSKTNFPFLSLMISSMN